jgi:hypothetical protein
MVCILSSLSIWLVCLWCVNRRGFAKKKVLMPLFLPRHECAGWLSVENDVIFQVLICTIVLSTW